MKRIQIPLWKEKSLLKLAGKHCHLCRGDDDGQDGSGDNDEDNDDNDGDDKWVNFVILIFTRPH